MNPTDTTRDYQRIAAAIQFLQQHFASQPSLAEVAGQLHLSEFHLQRLFTRWAGVSPKRFLQFLTKEHAKTLLRAQHSVESASHHSGLSGPSRLHDLLVECDGISPGEYKRLGASLVIHFGFHPTPFGDCLLGQAERGVCFLQFVTGDRTDALQQLQEEWALATLREDPLGTGQTVTRIFSAECCDKAPLRVMPRGTNFQIKVWEALLRIPAGELFSYQQLAQAIGQPQASRAVGSALARNSIGFVIPCHRVILGSGEFGHYRWGSERKAALIGWEQARTSAGNTADSPDQQNPLPG